MLKPHILDKDDFNTVTTLMASGPGRDNSRKRLLVRVRPNQNITRYLVTIDGEEYMDTGVFETAIKEYNNI